MTDKTEKKVYRHDPRQHDGVESMSKNETDFLEHEARSEALRIIERLSMKSKSYRRLVAMHLDSLTRKEMPNG